MEIVLAGLQWGILLINIDDVIVYGCAFEEALKNLETVLEHLRIAGVKLKAQKCKLFSKSVSFLDISFLIMEFKQIWKISGF